MVIADGGSELKLGMKFRWKTFGVSLSSTVEEFIPPERLAWSARSAGFDAYHT
jgi:hypothetical protein